jgi:formylglycine-generating enzyme required for sulfatase activity
MINPLLQFTNNAKDRETIVLDICTVRGKKFFLFTLLFIVTFSLFFISVPPSFGFEKDTSGEVIYHLEQCGDCHEVPAKVMEGIDTTKECDQCHNPAKGLVALASTAAKEESQKESAPADLDDMVYIPPGDFVQGSDMRHDDEGPEHTVYLDGYYIDKYEVTNLQYERFVKATGYPKPVHWFTGTYPKGKAYHPVIYVDWFNAKAYCEWAGKRLPTESEWEKAARGTDAREFPWGNEFSEEMGNVPDLGMGSTMPVGSFEKGKSPYGLYDMTGNVWEWTEDWYKPYAGSADADTNVFYGEKNKILKGGSWFECAIYNCGLSAYTYNRSHFAPDVKNNSFGFRCASAVKVEGPKDTTKGAHSR